MGTAENLKKLMELTAKHPELPVIAMVDGDVVPEEICISCPGEIGCVTLGEYTSYCEEFIVDDRDYFKEKYYDNNEWFLCEKFGYDPRISDYTVKRGEYTWKKTTATKRKWTHTSMRWQGELSGKPSLSASMCRMKSENLRRGKNRDTG